MVDGFMYIIDILQANVKWIFGVVTILHFA